MSDLLDEELEFRGGTLQLSTEQPIPGAVGNAVAVADDNRRTPSNVHPSVLSGADSLTSSLDSFTDARGDNPVLAASDAAESGDTVCPRYDVPFNRDNIKDFFTFRKGVVENAIQECITALLFPEDGEYLGCWLLTEITLWDNEKERIVLLTSRLVMVIKYDFIAMRQVDFKKTYLDDLDTIVVGELVYPPSSLVPRINGIASGVTTVVKDCVIDRLCRRPAPDEEDAPPAPAPAPGAPHDTLFDHKYFEPRERNLRGVRLMWNKGEALPLKTVWNPFSQDIPFLTFASHPIYWYKEGGPEERSIYDMEGFAARLQGAVEAMAAAACCVHRAPIVIQSYVGVASMLHNKTGMGFFKVRGKFSF